MMTTRWLSALAMLSFISAVPDSALAASASTGPGKEAVFASQFGQDVNYIQFNEAIRKGKKGHVLKVDMSYSIQGGTGCTAPTQIQIGPALVNGEPMQPTDDAGYFRAYLGGGCTLLACAAAGTAWLDIDAMEAAVPGAFVGQPLNIQVTLSYGGTTCLRTMWGTLSAVLVKK